MKKKHLLLMTLCSGFIACAGPTPTQQLAKEIRNDNTLHVVDSMARAVIRSGFNAGSGTPRYGHAI